MKTLFPVLLNFYCYKFFFLKHSIHFSKEVLEICFLRETYSFEEEEKNLLISNFLEGMKV